MFTLQVLFWTAWALVLYTYALFPLLLWLISRVRSERPVPQEPLPDAELPRVGMIVAAHNEEHVLAAKLANTWAIDYPAASFELLIGSDGSDDGTAAILRGCDDPRLRAFPFTERRGKIAVLNDLVARTDADILVMSDANTIFEPDAVRRLVSHFRDPRVGCVSGQLMLEHDGGVSGEGLYWKYESWIKESESRLGFLIGCNGGIYALRRELYRELPPSTVVEDFVLTMRVLEQRRRVKLDREARAVEPACASAKAEMVRKIRIGAGGYQAIGLTRGLLHPRFGLCAFAYWGHKVLRWLAPVFLLAALAANLALAGTALYASMLVPQALGLAIAWWSHRSGAGVPRWARPAAYFYLMNFALFCGLLRHLSGTQRVTWDRSHAAPSARRNREPHGLDAAARLATDNASTE
jgi:cellulose synthase/poly-beta-1,6-N-acetylglucosamine synthase-like glycosyltransferase